MLMTLLTADPAERQAKVQQMLLERLVAERGDLVMKNGWATMPGTTEGNRLVAIACANKVGV